MNSTTSHSSKSKEELICDLKALQTINNEVEAKLKERTKELQAIYKINSLMTKPNLSLDTILQKIVELIPPSWQYSEITCARIILGEEEVRTSNFKITNWKQTEFVPVKNIANAIIEVYYLEQKPNADEDPFLTEERNLLKLIANGLSKIIETKNLTYELLDSDERFSVSFQKSPVAKCLVDKSDNFKFLDVNEQFLSLSGFSRDELEGRFLKDINFFSEKVINSILVPNINQQKEIKKFELTFLNNLGEIKTGLLNIEIIELKTRKLVLITINDITERKRAELKNHQGEKRLQAILDNMQNAFFQADLSENILYVNLMSLQMYGYSSEEELLGKHVSILYANIKEREKLLEELKQTGKVIDYTSKALKKDGTTFWVSLNVQYVYDTENNITGIQGIVRDITDRLIYEQKLIESKKRFHDIFENMPSGYVLFELIYDKNGKPVDHRLIEANAEFEIATGLKRSELIGRISKEFPAYFPEDEIQQYYNVAITGKSFSYERFYNSLNRYYDTRVSSPQKGQFALLFNDISERKKAEKERLELLGRFKQIAKHLPGFIFQYHLKKDNSSCFPYASKGIKAIFGVTPKEAKKSAQCVFDVIHPDDLNRISESIYESARRMTLWHESYRVNLPSGRTIWVNAKCTPIKLEDDSILWHGYIQDITELINYQNKLIKARKKAEESDQLKSAFLQNISHEIRTPMNGILGFMDLLNQPGLDEKDRSEFMSIVNKSGKRLMNTIDDIVEVSKIEVGDVSLKYETVDLFELMSYFYNFFKIQTEEKGLGFEITKQITGSNALVTTDKQKLDGILMNLIKNAIKFTKNGKIEIGNYLENGYVWFYVSDTGIGISEDKVEAIFDLFVSVDNTLARSYEGSGIGLSITKAYIEALNGSIKVESELGKGSTFLFSIPYKPVEAAIEEPHTNLTLTKPNSKPIVLIAEDEEVNFYLLEKILADEYKILHAVDGIEAVKIFTDNPEISLILMDIKMPGEYDGLEATRKIRELNQQVPIIAQTAYAMEVDRLRAIEVGCNDVITKPFNTTKLLTLIKKYHNKKLEN